MDERQAMNPYLIVFFGSGLGGMLRHAANVWVPRMLGTAIPFCLASISSADGDSYFCRSLGLIIGPPWSYLTPEALGSSI
jgi:hypothetical protein